MKNKSFDIRFTEYIAENHYHLYNIEDGQYWWRCGVVSNDDKTTSQLYDDFINEYS